MHPAALGRGAGHGGLHGLAQAQVSVGDDQLHPGQAAGLERAQERRLECPVLGVAHGEAEDLTAAIAAHPVATTTAWETTRRFTLALQ